MNEDKKIDNATGLSECLTRANEALTKEVGEQSEAIRSAVDAIDVKRKKNGLPVGVHKEELLTKSGKEKRITGKMQAFASNVVKGMSPNDAYRTAYDCSNMAEASICSEANRLLKDPRITNLLQSFWESLKENVIADQSATRRHIMNELYKHANNDKAQLSNRLKSLELMGRAIGMFTDKVESKIEEVNVDSLKKELESSLALLDSHNRSQSKTH